jgi:tRNA modification GTPase
MEAKTDTICALSTPVGRSALGLIRISGPKSAEVLRDLAGILPEPRLAHLCILKNRRSEPLDEVVATYFKAPASYTGEDMVEICAHGNPRVLDEILSEIVSRETRRAEPGEFTMRALANGKLTLDQVESLDWVLNSNSIEGVKRGLRAKISSLAGSVEDIRTKLLNLRVQIEAQLDFSEAEVGELDKNSIISAALRLQNDLKDWAAAFDRNRYLLNSWTVVLVGPPNSGKSSLFNALVGFEKAIVFDQPGTTRDFVHHSLELNGTTMTLIDTAGIRSSAEPIEQLGIQKTYEMMASADLICWVTESGEFPPEDLKSRFEDKNWLFVGSKADLGRKFPPDFKPISVLTGDGVNLIKDKIVPDVADNAVLAESWLPLTSQRQRDLVLGAANALGDLGNGLKNGMYLDLAATFLDKARASLSQITGAVGTDEVLKSIFARFCIGK